MGNVQLKIELTNDRGRSLDVHIQDYLQQATARFVRKYHLSKKSGQSNEIRSLTSYTLFQCLGKGAFASVYLALEMMDDRVFFAIKVLNKRKILSDGQEEHVMGEKRLLNSVNFPFLIKLHHSFQDNSNLYLSLEYMPGGELFSLLRLKMFFSEETARFYAGQVVLALEYMHHLNIAYRDLKPENILLGSDGYLKVADFGFAKLVPNRTYTLCGTPEYLAPEIINSKGYSRSVDWWAFGVLVFELVAGFSPFFSAESRRVYEKILVNKYTFPRHFSREIRSLIKRLLEPDHSKRIGTLKNKVNDVKEQKWFFSQVNWVALFEKTVPLPSELLLPYFNQPLSLGAVTVLHIDSHDIYSNSFRDF